jgi:hypothetical protein
LAVSQRGQRLADGVGRLQAEARRLRLLALEVFFLGTAIVEVLDVAEKGARPVRGTAREGYKCKPAIRAAARDGRCSPPG